MINIEATSPQMQIVKVWTDAHTSRDLNRAEPILSKNFIARMFPKITGFPDLTKEEYLLRYSAAFALFSKVEVRIRHLGTAFKLSAD
jgi:hypothetical protein